MDRAVKLRMARTLCGLVTILFVGNLFLGVFVYTFGQSRPKDIISLNMEYQSTLDHLSCVDPPPFKHIYQHVENYYQNVKKYDMERARQALFKFKHMVEDYDHECMVKVSKLIMDSCIF